jgi:thiamine pyrophosphate-dependent acetolactate synthase large subunit-like protein
MRYPYELNVVGDAKATLQALIPLLERKSDRGWREGIESDINDWWETVERRALTDADPVNPMRIFHELSARLPANAIVAADSGSAANWYARHLKFHGDIRGSLSGTLAITASRWPMKRTGTGYPSRTSPTANATTTSTSLKPPPQRWKQSSKPPAPAR